MTNITDQLPYELCDGVVATVEGLVSPNQQKHKIFTTLGIFTRLQHAEKINSRYPKYDSVCAWPDIAKMLRYKPSAPAVIFVEDDRVVYWWLQGAKDGFTSTKKIWRLHRNACLLFDNAEGFMVLYQCIKEFGDG